MNVGKKLNRNSNEYKDLENLDIDEFHYALPYEFHIRANKERYKEYFNLFYIDENNELSIKNFSQIVNRLAKEREYILNLDNADILREVMQDMLNSFFGVMGNNGIPNPYYLYVDYHFFTDEEKKIAKLLKKIYEPKLINEWHRQTHLGEEQDIKTSLINVKNTTFTRTDIKTKINYDLDLNQSNNINLKGYKVEQYYEIEYKRPKIFALFGSKKTIKQEININLPREVILKQLERIVDAAKEDNKNILSNNNKMAFACYVDEPEIINSETKEFYKKRTIIDALFAYDYFSIRELEIKSENKKINDKLQKEVNAIKKNFSYDTKDKKERIREIKKSFKKLTNDDIYGEIQESLYKENKDLENDTIKRNILQVKKLLKDDSYETDKHFLHFINGI